MFGFKHVERNNSFNSTKVRLRHDALVLYINWCNRFNSTKVRLRHVPDGYILFGNLFQFHKGSIKTSHEGLTIDDNKLFQFHKGSIKTALPNVPDVTSIVSIPRRFD